MQVLRHLLNILPPGTVADGTIEAFLVSTELISRQGKTAEITADGYEYMLKDHHDQVRPRQKKGGRAVPSLLTPHWPHVVDGQVWIYVMHALSRSSNQEESLSFLFMLADCQLGRAYPINALTKSQRQMMFELYKIGLIYIRDVATSKRFYPTRAAVDILFRTERAPQGRVNETVGMLSSSSSNAVGDASSSATQPSGPGGLGGGSLGSAQKLHIIVETNLQVTAYLTTDLHLAMVRLFVDVSIIMPNMAMGRITRDRSKQAFQTGIRATQIIDFLKAHAHPATLTRPSPVPANVSDQLFLWEAEGFRVHAEDAVVVDVSNVRGIHPQAFKELYVHAKKMDVCLWVSEAKMMLAVIPDGLDLVTTYIQDHFEE